MNSHIELGGHNRPVSNRLHPRIYEAILALAFLFAVSVWGFFRGHGHQEGLNLAVVSGFVLTATLIVSKLGQIWRRSHPADAREKISFREWASGRFDTFTGRMKCGEAVIEILLPITAGALGLLLFATVLFLDVPGS